MHFRTMVIQKRFAEVYLMLGLLFSILGGSIQIGFIVGGPVLDESGLQVYDESGEPKWQRDHWATFLANWKSNVCLILAGTFFLLATFDWLVEIRRW